MRRLLFAALAAAAACGPTRQWVPLEVDWTFGGRDCASAGVAKIRIDIDGEILTPNQFTCAEAGQGAALGDFLAGPYNTTVTGYDAADNIVFQSTRTLAVGPGGKNVIPFDAAPTTGTASLRWTFAGKSCAAAGVATVSVSLDNQVITDAKGRPDLPCKDGTVEGTTIGPLSPGSHTFALAAKGTASDFAAANVNITVAVGQDTLVPVDLATAAPTTASADVRWSFQPGGRSCADVGADHLFVVFDPAADGSGGKVVADTACAGMAGPVKEISIVDIPDGNHSFAIRATRFNPATKADQLIFYTHRPVTTLFSAPFTTAVDVTVEATP